VEFTGNVSAISLESWTIEGQTILVDGSTSIDGAIVVGDTVRVNAVVDSTGAVKASKIEASDGSSSTPEPQKTEEPNGGADIVTGQLEAMTPDSWTVKGQVFAINAQTEIKNNILLGDVVKVHFATNPDGTLVATEIEKAGDNQANNSVENGKKSNETEFTGVVESIAIDSWVVSGQTFAVTPQTEIKGAIAVGDTVKVHTFTATDGTLTVREIELASESGNSNSNDKSNKDMKITGTLDQIGADQYVIGGQVILITPQTKLDSNLVIGSMVKAEVIVNPDGTLTALEIKLQDQSQNQGTSQNGDDKSRSGSENNSGSSKSNDGGKSGSGSNEHKDDHKSEDGSNHD
jgi:uncharacterized membrane protein YgcG